ncbi:unnamed protein product [Amoebophrya sp. A120]|nr:unnamed protein product [Amoebophrya sp. A120]|eukprot:GSA120T00009842001.1
MIQVLLQNFCSPFVYSQPEATSIISCWRSSTSLRALRGTGTQGRW